MKQRNGTEPLFLGNDEIIVDNFAGGGGASSGIEQAFGRPVDIAINHDPEAVAMHAINHPQTRHFCESVFKVNPIGITDGRPVALAWFSPDCKHFSKAKGGKPVDKAIRGLAWVVIRWARRVKPRVIMLENVEEFQDWGPLTDDGYPCPIGKGKTFNLWVNQLRGCGYVVEWRELRACDYGAPTIRKRLFVIARRDGLPIVWPAPTHGPGLIPYRTAAECINWALPCPSIFERERPLADNTMRRIARGVMKYIVNAAEPFIVGLAHGEHAKRPGSRVRSIDTPLGTVHAGGGNEALVTPLIARIGQTGGHGDYSNDARTPLTTITSKAEHLLVAPTLIQTGYGERPGQAPRAPGLDKPLGTIVSGGKHALVAAFLAQHNTQREGHNPGRSAELPISTITGKGTQQQVVSAILNHQYGSNTAGGDGDLRHPHKTITTGGHHALVQAFLMKYYGTEQDPQLREPLHTITARDRFGLVTVNGDPYEIVDIGMRMLAPRELYRAQGFPDDYIIEFPYRGKPLTKTSQVRMCGNSVPPPLSRALVLANCTTAAREAAA